MYAPFPQARPRIPYLTCLAAASFWYSAALLGYTAWAVKSGQWQGVLGALLIGLVPWLLSSLLVWLIMRTTEVPSWVLTVVALPFFAVLWMMISFFVGMAMVIIPALNGG
jgi:hypothetical protein